MRRYFLPLLIIGPVALALTLWMSLPDVSELKTQYPLIRYQGPKRPPLVTLQKIPPKNWARLSEISKVAIGAVIVSEDSAFYQHKGYDLEQMQDALEESLEEGRFVRGASTITQQVVRNVFLSKDKNLWRKLKELYLATRLERHASKRKILETYLNIAEWGEGLYGIRAASQYYFNKPPSALTAKEGAFLAMLLPNPKRYSQSFRSRHLTRYARSMVNLILERLTLVHYLSEEELTREQSTPLSFELSTQEAPSETVEL